MPQVTVPAEFFRGELRVYGDWREAFMRELLQNSTDARPTRIDIEFHDDADRGRVVFTDDGIGMTREVLENVYFALGKTTKTGPDTVGGFGRARILNMAQEQYTIRTGNLYVEGRGGDYTIREVASFHKGCRFEVTLLDESTQRVQWALDRLLHMSAIDVPVYVDGVERSGGLPVSRATRVLRDSDGDPWGKVYVNTDGHGTLMVRVHGLLMFQKWLSGADNVILELLPSRSREVLSASRDALHTTFGDQLDQFISDLALNRRAALRSQAAPLDECVSGGGFLATDSPSASVAPQDETADGHVDTRESLGSAAFSQGTVVTPANDAARANFQALAAAGQARPAQLTPEGARDDETNGPTFGFDVFMLATNTDTRVRRLMRRWSPRTWGDGKAGRQIALLLAWKAAVSAAMDALVTVRPDVGRVLWSVGWTFDEDTRACHRTVGDGHVLALNPATERGTDAYRLSHRESRQQLLAVALHEVCHVVAEGHDERFAALLTALFGAIDVNAADRAIRAASA